MKHRTLPVLGGIAQDIVKETRVVIKDPRAGEFASLDANIRDLIRSAPGNANVGFDDETNCVKYVYTSLGSVNSKVYTAPETRFVIPQIQLGAYDLRPAHFVQFNLLCDLLREAAFSGDVTRSELVALVKSAGVDEPVLDAIRDWVAADGSDIDAASSASGR